MHHLGLATHDLEKLAKFYLAALKPLGYEQKMEFKDGAVRGYGYKYGGPDFWLSEVPRPGEPNPNEFPTETSGFLHLAFAARTRNQVRAFHAAAV